MKRFTIPILLVIFVILLILSFNIRDKADVADETIIPLVHAEVTDLGKVVYKSDDVTFTLEPRRNTTEVKGLPKYVLLITEERVETKDDSPKNKDEDPLSEDGAHQHSPHETDSPEVTKNPSDQKESQPSNGVQEELSPGDTDATKTKETKTYRYTGSKSAETLYETLAQFPVLKELDLQLTDEKLTSYGLNPAKATLEITIKGEPKVFEIGNLFLNDRIRIRDPLDQKIYVANARTGKNSTSLSILSKYHTNLKNKQLSMIDTNQITQVEVHYREKSKTFKKFDSKGSTNAVGEDWRDINHDEATNEVFATWLRNINFASLEDYVVVENDPTYEQVWTEKGFDHPNFVIYLKRTDSEVFDTLTFVRFTKPAEGVSEPEDQAEDAPQEKGKTAKDDAKNKTGKDKKETPAKPAKKPKEIVEYLIHSDSIHAIVTLQKNTARTDTIFETISDLFSS